MSAADINFKVPTGQFEDLPVQVGEDETLKSRQDEHAEKGDEEPEVQTSGEKVEHSAVVSQMEKSEVKVDDPNGNNPDSDTDDGQFDRVEDLPVYVGEDLISKSRQDEHAEKRDKEPVVQPSSKVETLTTATSGLVDQMEEHLSPGSQVEKSEVKVDDPNGNNSYSETDDDQGGRVEDLPVQVEKDKTLKSRQDEHAEKRDGEPKVQPSGNSTKLMLCGALGVILGILGGFLVQPSSIPEKVEVSKVDVFLREIERTEAQFPSQHLELWKRSRIHLKRHLQSPEPTEPVSLILTAGRRAERTLHCLAQSLASALSCALNGSVLQIDGASKAGQESDRVKLDIDEKLRDAFEGDKPVAVIHRFEELPPGSTIIFYRYCDHENAAYKQASLIFTVLLTEDVVPTHLRLSAVEEMVGDHLQNKFLTSGQPASFNRMDLDKFGGLWSRISHLILPVAAEERVEELGCGGR